MPRAICICNPASRAALTLRQQDSLSAQFRRRGYEVEFRNTQYPRHATTLARQAVSEAPDLLIVAGGDGTINEVIGGAAFSNVPLAIIPSGTGNVLSGELKLPRSPAKLVDTIMASQPIRIALGRGDNGRYFILMAGVGTDADIIYRLNMYWKRRLGQLSFWLGGLRYWLTARFIPFQVKADGDVHTCTFLVVGRAAAYGGSLRITAGAHLLSDHFVICAFKGNSRLAYLRYLFAVLTGWHIRLRDVVYMRTRNVAVVPIRDGSSIKVQMDGELVGRIPMRFEVLPDALTILMPPEYIRRRRRYR